MDWHETDSGNWVLIEDDEVRATIYQKDESWRAVVNDDRLPRYSARAWPSAEIAQLEVERALDDPRDPIWQRPQGWVASRPKSAVDAQGRKLLLAGYWRRGPGGIVLSVRQTRGKSWLASVMGELLAGHDGTPVWFRSAEAARQELDRRYPGGGPLPAKGSVDPLVPLRPSRVSDPLCHPPDATLEESVSALDDYQEPR